MVEGPHTCEQIRREIAALRELLETQIGSLDAKMTARLDAMDRAVLLAGSRSNMAELNEIKTQFQEMVDRIRRLEKK